MGSFTPQPFYSQGKTAPPPYLLDRRLGGCQDLSRCCGEKKNVVLLPGINPNSFVVRSVAVTILIVLLMCQFNLKTK
jgi:hypothetical protein